MVKSDGCSHRSLGSPEYPRENSLVVNPFTCIRAPEFRETQSCFVDATRVKSCSAAFGIPSWRQWYTATCLHWRRRGSEDPQISNNGSTFSSSIPTSTLSRIRGTPIILSHPLLLLGNLSSIAYPAPGRRTLLQSLISHAPLLLP